MKNKVLPSLNCSFVSLFLFSIISDMHWASRANLKSNWDVKPSVALLGVKILTSILRPYSALCSSVLWILISNLIGRNLKLNSNWKNPFKALKNFKGQEVLFISPVREMTRLERGVWSQKFEVKGQRYCKGPEGRDTWEYSGIGVKIRPNHLLCFQWS